jgi:hypothetical protein
MRPDVAAWPPSATASSKTVERPPAAAYTLAANPPWPGADNCQIVGPRLGGGLKAESDSLSKRRISRIDQELPAA